ncbi:hypothetical protein AB9E13_35430, partial [Rhizobium leguminosarum]
PGAVDTAVISVALLRYRAFMCAGILCGFAGTYLAIAQSASFIKDMSAGKGYIALAALVFADGAQPQPETCAVKHPPGK